VREQRTVWLWLSRKAERLNHSLEESTAKTAPSIVAVCSMGVHTIACCVPFDQDFLFLELNGLTGLPPSSLDVQ
jgi:hypothetical protein